MSHKNPSQSPASPSRREFLKRSSVVLLPYAAPVIASMVIHVEQAEGYHKGVPHGNPMGMQMSRMMMGKP
jgi:hypothetical protein